MLRLKGNASAVGSGYIEGTAAATGNMDRQCEVLAPGCFAKCVQGFVDTGLLMPFHRWNEPAIGVIEDAKEAAEGLWFRAKFLDTEDAQRTREYCSTMQAAGRKVGISIGFAPNFDTLSYHRDGEDLASAAEKEGIVVRPEVREHRRACILVREIVELYEASVVTVPANPDAFADSVKQFLGGDGACAGLPLDGHIATALSVVRGALSRLEAVKAVREADGRRLNDARMAELDDIARMVEELKRYRKSPDSRHVARAVVEAELALAGT